MSKSTQIKFTLNHDDFDQQLQPQVLDNKECDLLEIIDVPSVGKTLELISRDWFKTKILDIKNLVEISFKISEEINDNAGNLLHFVKNWNKNSFVLAIRSTVGKCKNKIYWRVNGREEFYYLNIDEDTTGIVSSFCQEFLINEIKAGKIGLPSDIQHKNKIRLHELCDSNENNLLIQATSKNQLNVVQELLKNDFDADCAIDTAWQIFVDDQSDQQEKDQINEIILCLLKANSTFPDAFDYNKASKEVKEFVKKCESLHKDVDEDKFEALKLKLDADPDLIHFYNRNNESLLGYALKSRKFEIFELLKKEITTGCHEDLEEIYENMEKKEFKILREQHKENAKEFPETYILVLKSRCKIGNNDRLSHKKWKFIDEAFDFLNSNDYCRKILKVAAEAKKLKIYFDFKHDSTYYMDPATSIYSKGIIYEGGTIFIGAKNLEDDDKKFKAFGVIAHELCHLAVYLAFMNRNFDPFSVGESDNKTRFINRVMEQCKEREEFEHTVKNVFISYSEDLQDSEMIVTVPQMLMQYAKDPQKITELEGIFEELFKYSKEVVEPELDKALPVLKMLNNSKQLVKYEDLTEAMKSKILHSKIKFQGQDKTLYELIGNDNEILKLLSSDEIRKILLTNKELEIGQKFKPKCNKIVVRFFISFYDYNDKYYRNIFDIIEDIEYSRVMILSAHAGMGKTTMFEYATEILKNANANLWVSLIKLKGYEEIFKEFNQNVDNLNFLDVVNILLKIIKKSEIEKAIFKKFLSIGKVIFLFDGFDEISPIYTQLLTNMVKILFEIENNQIWISTRPHYAWKLSDQFHSFSTIYNFAPYTNLEKELYIKEILKLHDYKGDQNKIVQRILDYISHPKLNYYHSKSIDNPLMISIITKLYINNEILNEEPNDYELYNAMFNQQIEEADAKVKYFNDRNPFKKFTILNVHEVLALLSVIGNYNEDLNELKIMKSWNRVKSNFTSDMIQRYGFVTVDLNDLEVSIEFIHRSYAEFFVAMFIIDFIFDDNIDDNDEEIELKFPILIDSLKSDSSIVKNFLFSYLNDKSKSNNLNLHKKVKNLMSQKINKIHENLDVISDELEVIDPAYAEAYEECYGHGYVKPKVDYSYIGNYSNFFCHDHELSNQFWRIQQEDDLLKKLIPNCYENNFMKLLLYVEDCFGQNWHTIFNKSEEELITDEELEQFNENVSAPKIWNLFKNLIRFCDLVDKNYTTEEKLEFYDKVELKYIGITKIRWNIIPRMRVNANAEKFINECLEEICERTLSLESLSFVLNQFEKASNIDINSIRQYMKDFIPKILNNTYDSDLSGTFEILKNFFLKYFTKEEIEDSIVSQPGIFNIFEGCEHLFYTEYKQFIQDIFGSSNYSKIIQKIDFYFNDPLFLNQAITEKPIYENYKDFLAQIFSNDEENVRMYLGKVIVGSNPNFKSSDLCVLS